MTWLLGEFLRANWLAEMWGSGSQDGRLDFGPGCMDRLISGMEARGGGFFFKVVIRKYRSLSDAQRSSTAG